MLFRVRPLLLFPVASVDVRGKNKSFLVGGAEARRET
jgi:hypothetical protein